MPPNKKKGGGRSSNNKKQKKGQRAPAPASGTSASQSGSSANQGTSTSADSFRSIGNLPSFHGKNNDAAGITSGSGGYYEMYKKSTTNFWNWMKQALPKTNMKSVNDLKKGAATILSLNVASLDTEDPLQIPIVAPKEVLNDLSRSIQYRTMFSESKFGTATGGDQGHQYMIDVLKYCRSVLRFSRHVAKVAMAEDLGKYPSKEHHDVDGIGGRFNALMLDEDDEEEEKEDIETLQQDIRGRKFPNFQAPQALAQEIDIEQVLINGDDRFEAVALLQTMDDLMSVVEGHYGLLKGYLRDPKRRHDGSSVQLLMECAVAANMAVQSVHAAENALATHHPHVSSFYHVLALVFLPSYVADIEALMSTSKLDLGDSHMVLHFVAEIVECSFHNQGDKRIPAKVKAFAKKSGLSFTLVEEEARKIKTITMIEVQLANEEPMNAQLNALFARMSGVRPHMWLQQSAFIGGDACLLNTHKLIQMIMGIVKDSTKLVGRPGFWGKSFDEQTSPASRIRGDLNEAFAGCIIPELIELCKQAPWQQLPDTTPLMTVVDLLHRHLHGGDRTRPVSVALTFGLHAMLTSIFVLQGDGDLARIAAFSKKSYNTLFAQLDDISDPTKPPENAPAFYWNVGLFKQVVNFAKQLKPHNFNPEFAILDPAVAERLAYWNPLIGGEYMLYGTYVCSIGLGSATVDSLGQLRFALHLYNALKQQNASLDVPLLEHLDKVFANTKAIWVGGRPTKGSYCKHFWLAWGSSLIEATRMSCNTEELPTFLQNPQQHETNLTRDLNEILPNEYSASYRRLVQRDFTDEEDVAGYTVRGETDREKKQTKKEYGALTELLTHVNMTRDGMDEDEHFVLPVNFSAVGCILLEFVNGLSENMGWDTVIQTAMEAYPAEMRTGKTMGGRRMKQGGFNTSDVNLKHQAMAHIWSLLLSYLDGANGSANTEDSGRNDAMVATAAAFLVNYFQNIPKERYTFFVDTEEKAEKLARRSPLEGAYPHGRTGRTVRDPLPGFCHFKYSKRGQPVVRMIRPGKYTPFHPTPDGDVATPYVEQGSKLTRGPSGKYRHIASYSLDELIALGWDGATYTSTKGNHAANGHAVPFIVGYDSDDDDEYETIDVKAGKRAGIIGLPPDVVGCYMAIPDVRNLGHRQIVQIQNGR